MPINSEIVITQHCDNPADFIAALSLRNPAFNSIHPMGWIFRGVWDLEKFSLVPAALREDTEWREDLNAKTNNRQFHSERFLLRDFLRVADSIGLSLPEDTQVLRGLLDEFPSESESWPPREILSLMALAQHHGIPTRLLDWSRHPLKAARFAARRSEKETVKSGRIAVWALCIDGLKMLSDLAAPFTVVTAPSASNSNLRAQEGVFTLAKHIEPNEKPVDRRPADVLLKAWIEEHGITSRSPWFRCFTLPQSMADDLCYELALEGVTEATLFPDFYGVVRAIKDHHRWQRENSSAKQRASDFMNNFFISSQAYISRQELMLRLLPPPPGPARISSTMKIRSPKHSIVRPNITLSTCDLNDFNDQALSE